jgi:hypothetical protein
LLFVNVQIRTVLPSTFSASFFWNTTGPQRLLRVVGRGERAVQANEARLKAR